MGSGSAVATTAAIAAISAVFFAALFIGLGLAVILSLIPTYVKTSSPTVSGEKYCINNYQLNATLTAISPAISSGSANASYLLSLACTRILQSYSSDSSLSSCLVSNCNFTSSYPIATTATATNVSCYVVVYYSSRCFDQGATSGVNNTVYSSGNSICRQQRMSTINGALGSTLVQFTNVPSLSVGGSVYSVVAIYNKIFTNYTQTGAYYCGAISQSAITSAVNSQASG